MDGIVVQFNCLIQLTYHVEPLGGMMKFLALLFSGSQGTLAMGPGLPAKNTICIAASVKRNPIPSARLADDFVGQIGQRGKHVTENPRLPCQKLGSTKLSDTTKLVGVGASLQNMIFPFARAHMCNPRNARTLLLCICTTSFSNHF